MGFPLPRSHRATTAHLQSLYPFVSGGGLGPSGTYVGRDLLGGSFCFDPWDLYRRGELTSPNALVVGQIGRGKSTFIKTLVWRQLAFGRQAWIVDPKGEYGPLGEACGHQPVRLAPGGSARINPLEIVGRPGSADPLLDRVRRRSELACSLLASSLSRPLQPQERTAVELAVRAASELEEQPTLPAVVDLLLRPSRELAATIHTDVPTLAADGRMVALELRRLIDGDLAGMFDGSTTPGLDLAGSVVVLDLSAVFASAALPLLMTCATAWLQASLGQSDAKRLVVVDEAWAILSDLATARWLQSAFKLSRAYGVANLVVVHRLTDLRAVGDDGSAQQKLAEGLLADSETRVVFGQSYSEASATARLLDLSSTEEELVSHLPRGVALWRIGDRSFLIEHAVGPDEASFVDTDAAMKENPRQFPGSGAEFSGTEG